jgi:hypothetical protein
MALMTTASLPDDLSDFTLPQWQTVLKGDPTDALHNFLIAASRGDAMAMNMAGRCHEQGWGTTIDTSKAAHWYRQAIKLDLPEARYNLANLLAVGDGVPQDHAEAFALYCRAAEQGFAKAYAKVGRYFEDGQVVDKDPAAAFDCYRRGAEGGDFRGQFCYAGMLAAQGREAESLGWLQKVPQTATLRYLREAGQLLAASEHPTFRAIGNQMLVKASGVSA